MKLVPADEQKGGVLHPLAMSRLVIQQMEQMAHFRKDRMTRLPADFRVGFFDVGEDKGYAYEFHASAAFVALEDIDFECAFEKPCPRDAFSFARFRFFACGACHWWT